MLSSVTLPDAFAHTAVRNARYLFPPPSVQLLNSSLGPARDIGSTVDCVLSVATAAGVLLFGTVDVIADQHTGVAAFTTAALIAPLRSSVTFRAHCETTAGGTNVVSATSHVYGVHLEWQEAVGSLLFNTAPAVAPSVRARFVRSDETLSEVPARVQDATECNMRL